MYAGVKERAGKEIRSFARLFLWKMLIGWQ